MAHEIKMPQLSDTMNSGKILIWKKNIGDLIKRGDILAEVETDKANLEIESFQSGTLLEIKVPAEGTAKVGEIICILGESGEKISPAPVAQAITSTTAPVLTLASNTPLQPTNIATQNLPTKNSDRIIASPLAKKIAQVNAVDLTSVTGSGPNGRIIKRDIETAMHSVETGNTALQPEVRSTEVKIAQIGQSLTPLSKMRETIARRMQQSVTENPHFYVTNSIRMESVSKLRETLKIRAEYKGISINHFVIKACAYALEKEPQVNYAYRDGNLFNPGAINIGIITALPDGLLIPVIKDANLLSLKDIVFEAKSAVERAKAGRPSAQDLTGGTFSISNMGMFDVESFTAIINPGQGGVLAVSATKEVPVVEKGVVVPGLVMKATVSVDHRVIDGIMAATFLTHFKEALEQPALLAL